jgi:alkylated DNA repair dioxygenase AlkB
MNTLFPVEPNFPEGFSYAPDFLTEGEEADLFDLVKNIDLHNFSFQGFKANRKVASFGYDYSFDNGKLTKGKEIPNAFDFIVEKVSKHVSVPPYEFAELLVTEYAPGTVINWHRDAPPFDLIAGISIMGDCTFRLRPHDKAKQTRSSIISFPVNRRSLYIIQGPARSEWQHSITPVKQTRYSITLRTLKKK